jgi:hypothetical protein
MRIKPILKGLALNPRKIEGRSKYDLFALKMAFAGRTIAAWRILKTFARVYHVV